MSSIYIQEPPTCGKVLLTTSVGEIEIELWSRETPKTCRNFVQLCLEGFYNNTIFHRVIKGFIAQTGDPSGTGNAGESIYGAPFRNEVHSRLRFVRRGLVATATGQNKNDSQFFFTFAAAPILQNKHTIFGKVIGDTMFNMLKIENVDIDQNERPIYPPKILKTDVLHNPFLDIVPRIKINDSPQIQTVKKEKISATKNLKLLSFGDEAEEEVVEIESVNKRLEGKSKSTHDVLQDPHFSSDIVRLKRDNVQRKDSLIESDKKLFIENVENKLKWDVQQKSESSQKSVKKIIYGNCEGRSVKQKLLKNVTYDEYKKDLQKYGDLKKKIPTKGSSRENQTYEMLMQFKEKLKNMNTKQDNKRLLGNSDDEESEMWMTQAFTCQINKQSLAKDASTKDDNWYDITDPRNLMNKRRREDSKKVLDSKGKLL